MRALALAIMLALPRIASAQLLSPGPLSAAHANIDGDDNCGKCHESGKQVVSRLCMDSGCHTDLSKELNAGRGLHGKQYKGQACDDCHHEHIGRATKLIRWPGGAMDKLDHKLTGYPLEGGHAKVSSCTKCHTKTSSSGKSQFVNTNTACGACHKDPHAGKFTATCQKCHNVTDWNAFDRKQLDHALTRYPLTGKHADVQCEKCHLGTPPKWKPVEFATCEACHKDVHNGEFKPKACTACHDTKSWQGAMDTMRTQHPKLSLANGHFKVKCVTCHDRGNDKPPSKGSTCESCHKPIHVAKFGTNCKTCHASIKWVGLAESVGRDNHGKTRYPLAGKHAAVTCGACHKASAPVPKRYRGLEFGACASCHEDVHKGEYKALANGDCAKCHTVNGYLPTLFGIAEHAKTKLPLDGKHAATPCAQCHTAPRPRLNMGVGARECLDCHTNPHGDQFAKEMAKGGCGQCHTALDWHQAKIDHSTWPLVGTHARTACAGCHGEQKKGAEPAAYRGIPRDCEGCHDDVHAGQFRQSEPKKDCKTCHDPETFLVGDKFDHDKTRYPLKGAHKPLECSKCHMTETLRDGSSSVRWRLGYLKCKDCHANPHTEGQ